MIRVTAAMVLLGAWLVTRIVAPGLHTRLPVVPGSVWRFLLPPAAIGLAASASPAAAAGLAVSFLVVHRFGTRSLAVLRREIRALARDCETALGTDGRPVAFPDVAACVLMERFSGRDMTRAEAVATAGRCAELDDLAAQIALREGGMRAYAAYVRRYGMTGETADADRAALGDRFPGGTQEWTRGRPDQEDAGPGESP